MQAIQEEEGDAAKVKEKTFVGLTEQEFTVSKQSKDVCTPQITEHNTIDIHMHIYIYIYIYIYSYLYL